MHGVKNEHDEASAHVEIDPEGDSRLTIQRPDGGSDGYSVTLRACPSPTCWCRDVELVCTPLDTGDGGDADACIIAFNLVEEQARQPWDDESMVDMVLARTVARGLTAEGWMRLTDWLVEEKRRIMEHMDLDSLEVSFSPDVTNEGMMAGYEEIFPFAEPLTFSTDEQSCIVDDQYCVQPDCSCNDAVLCFFVLPRDSPTDHGEAVGSADQTLRVTAAVRYDLRHRTWEIEDDPPVSPSTVRKLMTALEEACPDFPAILASRRHQLRRLFKRWIAGSGQPRPLPAVSEPKIGRNQPCPCGSGRKYKRCCGG
jgi:hypothetical protein